MAMNGIEKSWAVAGIAVLCACRACGADDVYSLLLPRPVSVETVFGTASPEALDRVRTAIGDVGAPAWAMSDAYRLEISSDGVVITSFGRAGERYARTTLAQLRALAGGGPVPCGTITDWPALRWRGLLLDCGRNWADLSLVRDIIDHLARYKMNVFHWHLTDFFGWRLESKKYPQLQSDAAFGRQKGCYCTQEEFKAMVAYAAERGVTIVPELDVPGHTDAFRRAFGFAKMNTPGVDGIVCDLIDELCSLAPASRMPFIHLGTDEVRNEREMVPDAWYDAWARRVARNGRTVVGWWPGHALDADGVVYQETWYETRTPTGPYVDATCYYIDSFDPAGLLAQAAFKRPCPYQADSAFRIGAEIQAWHDDAIANPSDLVRDNQVFAAVVLFSDSYWRDRAKNRTDLIFRPPSPDRPEFAEMADLERRALAQRDRVLRDFPHPLHIVGQTHMRWRLEDAAGRTVAANIPAGVVYVRSPRFEWGYPGYVDSPTGVVALVGRFTSPVARDAGAIIELDAFHRSGGRIYGTPHAGKWNRHGAVVTLNGERLAPPEWNHPGRGLAKSENVPWTDESGWIRPFTPIRIRKGLNEVRLVLPKTDDKWYWSATFLPVEGSVGHPREIGDLAWEDTKL